MEEKEWTLESDFKKGNLDDVVAFRNDDLQLNSVWSVGGDCPLSAGQTTTSKNAGCGVSSDDAMLMRFGWVPNLAKESAEYNGISWGSVAVMTHDGPNSSASIAAGATSTVNFGGASISDGTPDVYTQDYNGISWSNSDDMNTEMTKGAGCGTQSSAFHFAGVHGSAEDYNPGTEKYNGISWSIADNILGHCSWLVGVGASSEDALQVGGYAGPFPPTPSSSVYSYNGTSWSYEGVYLVAFNAAAGFGTTTAAVVFGGHDGSNYLNFCAEFNGVSWYVANEYPISLMFAMGGGRVNNGIGMGGKLSTGGKTRDTYEYHANTSGTWTVDLDAEFDEPLWGDLSINNDGEGTVKARFMTSDTPTFFVSDVWSLGGDLSTARAYLAGLGTRLAALAVAGLISNGDRCKITDEYNGISWSLGGDLLVDRAYMASAGTLLAGLVFGGWHNGNKAETYHYNGISWSGGGDLNDARYIIAGCGTQTAALRMGGSGYSVNTEEYNGISWLEVNDLNVGRQMFAGCGTQTAALCTGGETSSWLTATTEEYDGFTWSSVDGDLNTIIMQHGVCGTQTTALCVGGYGMGVGKTAQVYNGYTWNSSSDLGTGVKQQGMAGTKYDALSFGGFGPVVRTEEFTAVEESWSIQQEIVDTLNIGSLLDKKRYCRLELTLEDA